MVNRGSRAALTGLGIGLALALIGYVGAQWLARPLAPPKLSLQIQPFSYACAGDLQLGRSALCDVYYFPLHPTTTNTYVHVDIIADSSQLAVRPVQGDDIHLVPSNATVSWQLQPKVPGTIDYVVKYTEYKVDSSGAHHNVNTQAVVHSH